jgi:hypothetical protein
MVRDCRPTAGSAYADLEAYHHNFRVRIALYVVAVPVKFADSGSGVGLNSQSSAGGHRSWW